VSSDHPGVVRGSQPEVFAAVHALLGSHRAWERFGPVLT
jgi:hypothetical protein